MISCKGFLCRSGTVASGWGRPTGSSSSSRSLGGRRSSARMRELQFSGVDVSATRPQYWK